MYLSFHSGSICCSKYKPNFIAQGVRGRSSLLLRAPSYRNACEARCVRRTSASAFVSSLEGFFIPKVTSPDISCKTPDTRASGVLHPETMPIAIFSKRLFFRGRKSAVKREPERQKIPLCRFNIPNRRSRRYFFVLFRALLLFPTGFGS